MLLEQYTVTPDDRITINDETDFIGEWRDKATSVLSDCRIVRSKLVGRLGLFINTINDTNEEWPYKAARVILREVSNVSLGREPNVFLDRASNLFKKIGIADEDNRATQLYCLGYELSRVFLEEAITAASVMIRGNNPILISELNAYIFLSEISSLDNQIIYGFDFEEIEDVNLMMGACFRLVNAITTKASKAEIESFGFLIGSSIVNEILKTPVLSGPSLGRDINSNFERDVYYHLDALDVRNSLTQDGMLGLVYTGNLIAVNIIKRRLSVNHLHGGSLIQ